MFQFIKSVFCKKKTLSISYSSFIEEHIYNSFLPKKSKASFPSQLYCLKHHLNSTTIVLFLSTCILDLPYPTYLIIDIIIPTFYA
jgi:hypothetical protein